MVHKQPSPLGSGGIMDHKSLSTVVTKLLHALKQVKQKCLRLGHLSVNCYDWLISTIVF